MAYLIAASSFFILIHFLIAGTRLRDGIIQQLGIVRFRQVFSAMAAIGLISMVVAFNKAEHHIIWEASSLWGAETVFPVVFFLGNLMAFLLLVTGTLTPSPNSLLTEKAYQIGLIEVQGILRITRHPGMLGIGLWALMHLLANGDSASAVFFGSLATLSLLGPLSMDRKKLRLDPERYSLIVEQTSYLPFVAILRNKNHISWSEIGWQKPALAIFIYAATVFAHPWIAGVALI